MKVPTLDQSEVQLKPSPINPKSAATLGNEVVDLSEGLTSIGKQISRVQDITQENNAIKYLADANNATHNKYQTDPNLEGAEQRANDDLDKNIQSALNSIHNPEARNMASSQLYRMRDSKATAISNTIQARILSAGKASVRPTNDAFQIEYNGANTPIQEEDIKKRYNDWMDKQISIGHINPESAEDLRRKQNYQFGVGKAINDIDKSNDTKVPQTVLSKLDNGDYGDLKEQDYNHIKNRAEQKIQSIDIRTKKAAMNIQERNARDLDYMLKTKNPNIQQHAEELYYTGQINQKTFDNYTGKGKTPVISQNTDGASYIESLAYIADPKTSISDARNFIMKKFNDNQLSPEDRNKLYDMAIRPMGNDYKSIKDVIGLEQSKKDEQDTFKRHLNASLDFMRNVFHVPDSMLGQKGRNKEDDKSVQMAKRFVKKLQDNVSPESFVGIAHEVVNEQRILDRPDIAGYPEGGSTEQDEDGNRAMVKPDGSIQQDDASDTLNDNI